MNKKAERAMELRSGKNGHYNCAQAVLIPTWEELGLDEGTAKKVAQNLGMGMKLGSTCGAVTGGLIALGLKGADDETVAEYMRIMRERHGGSNLNCPDLLKRNQEQVRLDKKAHCDGMITESIERVEELLAKK